MSRSKKATFFRRARSSWINTKTGKKIVAISLVGGFVLSAFISGNIYHAIRHNQFKEQYASVEQNLTQSQEGNRLTGSRLFQEVILGEKSEDEVMAIIDQYPEAVREQIMAGYNEAKDKFYQGTQDSEQESPDGEQDQQPTNPGQNEDGEQSGADNEDQDIDDKTPAASVTDDFIYTSDGLGYRIENNKIVEVVVSTGNSEVRFPLRDDGSIVVSDTTGFYVEQDMINNIQNKVNEFLEELKSESAEGGTQQNPESGYHEDSEMIR